MEFGKVLRDLRERSRITQKQLADSLGVSKATISLYELQERMPSADILISVSSYFHVSVDYLLGFDQIKRADLSGLNDEDIEAVNGLIEVLRSKNQKYVKQMSQKKMEVSKQEENTKRAESPERAESVEQKEEKQQQNTEREIVIEQQEHEW